MLAAAAYPSADLALESSGAVRLFDFDLEPAFEALQWGLPCDRLDDSEAKPLVLARDSAENLLCGLVADWPRIHTIAMRLIEKDSADDAFLDEVMDPWAAQQRFVAMNGRAVADVADSSAEPDVRPN